MTTPLDDNDLERLLRRTLSGRAGTIDSGPQWGAGTDAEVLALGPHRPGTPRRRWPAVLVAAAAVVVITGGVIAIDTTRHTDRHHHTRPTTPTATGTITRSSCVTGLPASWSQAAARSTVSVPDQRYLAVDGVLSDGSIAVVYNSLAPDPAGQVTYSVGVIPHGSSTIRMLGSFHTSAKGLGVTVDVDDQTVLVGVDEGINHSERATQLVAFDAGTGKQVVVADAATLRTERLEDNAYVLDGHVYWQTEDRTKKRTVRVHDTTLSTGIDTVVSVGDADLAKSAAGVVWDPSARGADRSGHLPAVVAAHLTNDTFDSFVTDGTSYAWETETGAIDWWTPGAKNIVTVPGLVGRPFIAPNPGFVTGVAGPIVYYQAARSEHQRLLDTRTGASASVPDGPGLYGFHGTFVGESLGAETDRLLRLPTSELPELRC